MVLKALGSGYRRVRSNLRLVVLAWALNAGMALLIAVPFMNQLDSYIAPTAKEEELLLRLDENWYRTYQFDMRSSPYARLFDYSTIGSAPFIHHLDGMLSGGIVRTIGGFLWDSITSLRLRPGQLDLLALLALGYSLIGVFLSAGLVSAYAKGKRVSLQEFTSGAATFFGRFFRLSLISFIVMYLLLIVAGRWLGSSIATATERDASEWTAFMFYMGKNVILLLSLWLIGLVADYAKVRLVLEERLSAIDAVGAGLMFLRRQFGPAVRLSLILAALVVALMGAYALIVANVRQTTFTMIVLMVVVQQIVMAGRMCVKAGTYAGEVALVRLAYSSDENGHSAG
jgi:hypothetical protein